MEMTTIQKAPPNLVPDQIVNMAATLRDDWDRPGIIKAVRSALIKFEIGLVYQVTIDTAKDVTARTPGVIAWRCQQAELSGKYTQADVVTPATFPVGHCGRATCNCDHQTCDSGWIADDSEQPCPLCRPHMVQAGIELARARAHAAAIAPAPASPEFVRALITDVKAGLPRHRNAEAGQCDD
jgi:hypothetical protein